MELMQASKQWATRPDDQRFTSLTDLADYCEQHKQNSRAGVVASRGIKAIPLMNDAEHKSLVIEGPGGNQVAPTNWAFGQLCQRAGAPAGYVRDLPAELAADCINYGLHVARPIEDVGILLYKNGGAPELSAVTGPNYGRVWNSTIANALVRRFGNGVTPGGWKVPGEFGKAVEVTKANTTLYASDRDMFVFLADEEHRIDVPGRRDGKSGTMARGAFFWNSEVGAQTFGVAFFLFDYVCCNRIVWGAQGYQEIRIRHTKSAPDKFIGEVMPAIEHFANAATTPIVALIESAKAKKLDDIDQFLKGRFSGAQASAIQAAHMADEQRPIETLWDAVTGVTAYARGIAFQDARVDIEREGGKILQMAA